MQSLKFASDILAMKTSRFLFVYFLNFTNSLVVINKLLQDDAVVAKIRIRYHTEICQSLFFFFFLVKVVLKLAVVS